MQRIFKEKTEQTPLFGKQHWVLGDYQTKVQTLIPKQMENRLVLVKLMAYFDK